MKKAITKKPKLGRPFALGEIASKNLTVRIKPSLYAVLVDLAKRNNTTKGKMVDMILQSIKDEGGFTNDYNRVS